MCACVSAEPTDPDGRGSPDAEPTCPTEMMLAGLRWSDVPFDAQSMTVRAALKMHDQEQIWCFEQHLLVSCLGQDSDLILSTDHSCC